MQPSNYYMYSGGAEGSDKFWGDTALRYGIPSANIKHFWHEKRTPFGNTQLTDLQLDEGWQHVLVANVKLKRKPHNYKSLLGRNWFQVYNAEAVYGIAEGVRYDTVDGGTGWAVQMAIDSQKPVYVFDQYNDAWLKYNYKLNKFILMPAETTPILTTRFAGIGTRTLEDSGKQAIIDVFEATFKQ